MENSLAFLQFPYDPVFPFLGIQVYLREINMSTQKLVHRFYSSIIIAKSGNNPNVNEWRDIQDVGYPYNGILLCHNRMKYWWQVTTLMNLGNNEEASPESMSPFTWVQIEKVQKQWLAVAWGWWAGNRVAGEVIANGYGFSFWDENVLKLVMVARICMY